MFEKVIKFFRPDLNEVLGISFDGTKIYFTRIFESETENFEVDFEPDPLEKISIPEQLAEKITVVCAGRGWKTSATGFCLATNEVEIYQDELNTLPKNEISEAAKIWAKAQTGEGSYFDFIELPDSTEFWVEGAPKKLTEDYISAWQKNSMTLRVLTAMPEKIFDYDSYASATFVAGIVKNQGSPNLLKSIDERWNFKKISAAVFAGFFVLNSVVLANFFNEHSETEDLLIESRENLNLKSEAIVAKKSVEKDISEMKRLYQISEKLPGDGANLNVLLKLGKIADGKTGLTKIEAGENFLRIEGLAENSEDVGNYLNRLKSEGFSDAKIETSTENDDGEIIFATVSHIPKKVQ